jgi:GxxExxY protein
MQKITPAENAFLERKTIGAAIEVHKKLGPGYLESIYEEALAIELAFRGIAFERQKNISVTYRGVNIGDSRLDFLINGSLIVELKAIDALGPVHTAQVISYLKATGLKDALLINFNVPMLKQGVKHVVLSKHSK